LGNDNLPVAESLHILGALRLEQGRVVEAEKLFRESLAMRRKLLNPEDPDVAESLNNLAVSLVNQGKLAEAEPLSQEVLRLDGKLFHQSHPKVTQARRNLELLGRIKKMANAEAQGREPVPGAGERANANQL